MKKLLLTFALAFFTTVILAQNINFGIKAGGNLSNVYVSHVAVPINTRNLTGFQAGVIFEIGFGNFAIQPGLTYITKGTNGTMYNAYNRLYYLDAPLNLLYKIELAHLTSVYFGAGPYVSYGLSGYSTSNITNDKLKISFGDRFKFGYNNPDRGANFIAGIKLHKITFDINYELGLRNLSYKQRYPESIKSKSIGFSVGYLFR